MAMHAQINYDADSGEPPPIMHQFHPFYRVPKPSPPEATADILMAFGFRPLKQEVADGG